MGSLSAFGFFETGIATPKSNPDNLPYDLSRQEACPARLYIRIQLV